MRIMTVWLLLLALTGCSLSPTARHGMYSGSGQRDERPQDPPFDANAIDFGARWFPTYLRFAPDDSNFLASLCHVRRPTFCLIGRYTLATKNLGHPAVRPIAHLSLADLLAGRQMDRDHHLAVR